MSFTEKYRPKTVNDVIGHFTIKQVIQKDLYRNIILHGPSGSGKTSMAISICNDYFSETGNDKVYHEINASDERGIAHIRTTIKKLSRLKELKIIILDEIDSMTKEAQFALRMIIMESNKYCRFILICNDIYKIIPPIRSRCHVFYFQSLSPESMKQRLVDIATAEHKSIKHIDTIIEYSRGDLRRAVQWIELEEVPEIIPEFEFTRESLKQLYLSGYVITDVLHKCHQYALEREDADLLSKLTDAYYHVVQGAHPLLVLWSLI